MLLMALPLLLCLQVILLFMSGEANAGSAPVMFPVDSSAVNCTFPNASSSFVIPLQTPFMYNGQLQNTVYVSYNGFLAFDQPDYKLTPSLAGYRNIIAPLWTSFHLGEGAVTYTQATNGPLVNLTTNTIKDMFPMYPNFVATWVLVVTWQDVVIAENETTETFQAVLTSNGANLTFVLMNYETVNNFKQLWLAGFAMSNFKAFEVISVRLPDLVSTSNFIMPGRWVYEVHNGPNVRKDWFCFLSSPQFLPSGENYAKVNFQKPFKYFGNYFDAVYVNENGVLSFSNPLNSSLSPDINADINIIAPLWANIQCFESLVGYQEYTGPLVPGSDVLDLEQLGYCFWAFRFLFADLNFRPSWALSVGWEKLFSGGSVMIFQVILFSDNKNTSLAVMIYHNIQPFNGSWLAGYGSQNPLFNYKLPVNDTSQLTTGNTVLSWWNFRVDDKVPDLPTCDHVMCAENEVCYNGELGIGCYCVNKTNPDSFDAIETCTGNSGSVSFSVCQLFEAGYDVEALHLKDPNCTGVAKDGRLVFSFNTDAQLCGGTLESNSTHLTYSNTISSISGLISHKTTHYISVSCAYPLNMSVSLPIGIQAAGGVINKEVPSKVGTFPINMFVYPNNSFTKPYSGNVTIEVNQQIYVAVKAEGFNSDHVATVLDKCWATPNMDPDSKIFWNLIIKECPNPDDGTVQVLQNGISTFSYFSFRMFSFSGLGDDIFLHCQVHLCLLDDGTCTTPCPGNSQPPQLP